MTIHSSKGLQFEHIFLIYLDTLNIKSQIENLNSRLCYIGMTRSEKSLALLYSGHSEIVEKMISLAKVGDLNSRRGLLSVLLQKKIDI